MILVEWKTKGHEEDLCSVTTSQTCTPRHTIRHREPHILPTFANAASDMDNLDDVIHRHLKILMCIINSHFIY